jgi:hypothetical protein
LTPVFDYMMPSAVLVAVAALRIAASVAHSGWRREGGVDNTTDK